MVVIRIANNQVDLYDRERDSDSKLHLSLWLTFAWIDHDISDTVLHMMDLASRIIDIEFNED